jgi:Protein of unknown function (DUF2778)
MQGIDGTIGDISLERGDDPGRAARHLILGAVAAATVGCIAAYALHARHPAAPAIVRAEATPAPAAEDPEKLFGSIIVEPEWRAATAERPTTLASLGPEALAPPPPAPPAPAVASLPAPGAAHAPPVQPAPPGVANLLPEAIPLPPVRDVPQIEDSLPLPPVRPPEFAEPIPNLAPLERNIAQPSPQPNAAPEDNRNIFQKLLGIWGQPPGLVASRPPAPPAASRPQGASARPAPATTVVARPAPGEGRSGFASLFGAFPGASSLDRLGYDRQTAIYDISARAVYLPDGTRLEAHSGLGAALDDARYVGERAIGPTPPHLYELTMRESLFHGVQAIRLTPVGEGGIYGRAGLLAHPYMLGPNGDSNGCVSVKNYAAFLRAYQNGQIRKLAVVAKI